MAITFDQSRLGEQTQWIRPEQNNLYSHQKTTFIL